MYKFMKNVAFFLFTMESPIKDQKLCMKGKNERGNKNSHTSA
jgi:hypothetical protein